MNDIHYLSIIPAENPARRSNGLNLLLMVDNRGDDNTATVRFWGDDGCICKELLAKAYDFPARSHVHAYFHIPASSFSAEFWGGEAPEEISVRAGESPSRQTKEELLIFLEP